ncbi:MAG: 2-oxo acid dehydrogenase subunit E2 [Chloroflexi bacterium]|nr:2-oxo acid dehydrogenase subunit E2 [Chloroflexota bacterium]
MATSITMPQLGESVVEGTIARWLKREGETIQKYEPLVEVITEKVNVEVPSPVAGTLQRIAVPEGATVPVGTEIAVILEAGEVGAPRREPEPVGAASTQAQRAPEPALVSAMATAIPVVPPADGPGARRYTPVVVRLAQQYHVNLEDVPGTGLGGRVTKEDLLRYLQEQQEIERPTAPPPPSPQTPLPEQIAAAAAHIELTAPVPSAPQPWASERVAMPPQAPVEEEIIPLTPMRRAIAEHMARSARTIPHAWTMVEVDVTGLVQVRAQAKEEFQRRTGLDLTYLPFVIKAVAEALRENPMVNSAWGDDHIIRKRGIHIGVAVSRPDGLLVPVIRRADELNIAGLARACSDLIERARRGNLSLNDVQGSTFTVNNPGTFGSVLSQPIVPVGQAAILNMEAIIKRPVVRDNAIAIRAMINLCLSFDHRILDGAEALAFLQAVRWRLEAMQPGMMV